MLRTVDNFFSYQKEALSFLNEKDNSALFIDTGKGKTAIALARFKDFNRVLIVMPSKVLKEKTWERESVKWDFSQKYTFQSLGGGPTARKQVYKNHFAKIHLLSYGCLASFQKEYGIENYDCIVFDELSFLKSVSSKTFRSIRWRIKNVKYRYGLTATPVGNSLRNLWSQMWSIALDKPLGPTFTEFDHRYFIEASDHVFKPFPNEKECMDSIMREIKPWVFALKKEDSKVNFRKVLMNWRDFDLQCYKAIEQNYFLELGDKDVSVFAQGPARMKLRQICSGFVYDEDRNILSLNSETKIKKLQNLVQKIKSKVLIFYQFKPEIDLILQSLPGVEHIRSKGAFSRFCDPSSPTRYLLAHPRSAGYGLDGMQHVCNNIVSFTLGDSSQDFIQAYGRVDRTGQPKEKVWVHMFCMRNSVEEKIYEALIHNGNIEKALKDYFINGKRSTIKNYKAS